MAALGHPGSISHLKAAPFALRCSGVALCVLCGAGVALGTFFIGVFPWDVYSYLHFACASGVFWGGCFYSFFTCLLCLGISCEYPLNLLGTRSRWRMMYTWLTPLCGFCLLAVFLCLFAAYDTRPEFFSWTWWPEIQASAREDFLGYCSGPLTAKDGGMRFFVRK